MKPKTDAGQRYTAPSGGCSFSGCIGIGCLVVFLLIAVIGIGGYFSLMHTSMPLQFVESAIEQSGDVEIEGLDGTLSSGFSAKEFRFKTNSDDWSELKDINFKYNSKSSFFGGDKLIIDDISVKSGKIFAEWDPEEQKIDLTPDFTDEFQDDVEFNFNGNGSGELVLNNISINDLEIVNTATDTSVMIDEVSLKDFSIKDGELESLGTLTIQSNQLEVTTENSAEFGNMDVSTRLTGTMKSNIDARLEKDFAFNIDFGTSGDLETQNVKVNLFDAGMKVDDTPEGSSVEYSNFDLAGYLSEPASFIAPKNINFKLKFNKHDELITEVSENGSVDFGVTTFKNVRTVSDDLSNELIADGTVDGKFVSLTFKVASPFSPWDDIALQSEGFDSQSELWSQTLFAVPYEDASAQQQELVTQISSGKDRTKESVSDSASDSAGAEAAPEGSASDDS